MSEELSSARTALPTELLSQTFAHLESSSPDLYHVLLASRCFYEIAKPLLYRHIIITTREQRKRLENVKEEDNKLVRHVTIKGDGPIDVDDVQDHFESEHCKLGENCVRDLLTGKVLDISVIETLHIRSVHEDEAAAYDSGGWHSFKANIASNLVELSIWDHQGGGRLWDAFLNEQNFPRLRRLGYWKVTCYEWEPWIRSVYAEEPPEDNLWEDDSVELGRSFPLSQLEVCVAACPFPSAISAIPESLRPRFLSVSAEDCLDFIPSTVPIHNFRFVFSTIDRLVSLVSLFSKDEFRGISGSVRHFFVVVRSHNSIASTLKPSKDRLAAAGVVMHEMKEEEYDSNATSLIFPSFTKFLEESGQMENGGK
ncbi:uncharacterized protein JCM6883_000779 [Sporobolomyces salmoneus]|uniref:uncharacterized protein n=1 Tax=Sporobolomyces salmoneus TaxID=183962 RepID=UPI00317E7A5F